MNTAKNKNGDIYVDLRDGHYKAVIFRDKYQPSAYVVCYTIKWANGTYQYLRIINEFASIDNAARYAMENDPNNPGIYSIGDY